MKRRRYVVVVQGDASAQDAKYPRLLVAPFSTRDETDLAKGCNDVPVKAGEGNLTDDCYCLLGHVQPVLKDDIKDFHGPLPADRVEELQATLATVLGLISDDAKYGF